MAEQLSSEQMQQIMGAQGQSGEQEEQKRQAEEEAEAQRQTMLAAVLDASAKERLSRIAIVKPDKAKAVENMVLGAAQRGALRGKVSDEQIVDLLQKVGGGDAGRGPKITFMRKAGGLDDDDW
ncbi:unnamed protein product [Pedinophyceae sp. YPF-701]|nr:unnamed protein product [Pedinophyceae sp. YPF-701]